VYSQLARRIHARMAGLDDSARVAKMDVRSNDLPDDVIVERLPCLKLFTASGGVIDVPHELYREEEQALQQLEGYLDHWRWTGPKRVDDKVEL